MSLDASGAILEVNEALEALLGYAREDVIGSNVCEVMVRAGDHALVEAELVGRTRAFTLLRADRTELGVELTCTMDPRSPASYTWLIRDLDELSIVARSAAMASTAGQLGEIGTYEWDVVTGQGRFSAEMSALHGLDPAEGAPSFDRYLDLVHPDDRAGLMESVMTTRTESRTTAPSEWRITRTDGQTRRLLGSTAPLVWERGEIVRVVGTVQDVTDRWMAEVELALHAAVSAALAAWNAEDGGVEGLLRQICLATGWRMGTLMPTDRDADTIGCHTFWVRPDEAGSDYEQVTRAARFRRGEGLPGRVWKTGEAASVWEVLTDDPRAVVRPWSAELGGAIAFSVASPGRRFDGVMEFATGYTGPIDDGLRRTLLAVGLQLGEFLARHRADLGDSPISKREREVLQLASRGGTTASIAAELVVSPSTVKTHFEKIYAKLGVSDRAEAVAEAFRRGIVD